MYITNHARERAKDRLGVSKKTTDKIAEKALSFGLSHNETNGRLKKYIDGLYFAHPNTNNFRIYNRKVYIFKDTTLITILNLPNNLIKIADAQQEKKIKK